MVNCKLTFSVEIPIELVNNINFKIMIAKALKNFGGHMVFLVGLSSGVSTWVYYDEYWLGITLIVLGYFLSCVVRAMAASYQTPTGKCNKHIVSGSVLSDKELEEHIWEEIELPLSNTDKILNTDSYKKYLDVVEWAKFGRDYRTDR